MKFRVNSSHAVYEIEGLTSLKKLLREIEVIERVRREEDGTGFVDGVVDSVRATGDGLVHLVVHPVKSVKGVGRAVGKLGGKIGGAFREKEPGEATAFSEKVLGSSEREIAAEFDVDVYTSNPHLQDLLRQMARARLGGKGTATAVKFLLPMPLLISVTATVGGINRAADQLVNDHGRADLFEMNQDSFLWMGFPPEEIKRFLNLPHYSPREATYMRFYLEQLKETEGFREILRTASHVKSVREARKILYETQMLADAAVRGRKFRSVRCFPEGVAAEGPNEKVFFASYDYLDESLWGDRVMQRVLEWTREDTAVSVEIWNSGQVTGRFQVKALSQGILVRSWRLFL